MKRLLIILLASLPILAAKPLDEGYTKEQKCVSIKEQYKEQKLIHDWLVWRRDICMKDRMEYECRAARHHVVLHEVQLQGMREAMRELCNEKV